jgi:hypothetical protein
MTKIIDTNNETTQQLEQLKNAGVECVVRYISTNTAGEKTVKPEEARAIAEAGLKLALVFEVWGGADDFAHEDIHAENGKIHGDFSRRWATNVGAPDNTIIWFAIDTDVSEQQFDRFVRPYLVEAKKALAGKYRIGIYGCGYVCATALDNDLADAAWLSNAMGWNGSRAFRESGRWRLLQGPEATLHGLSIDPIEASGDDHGAFVPWAAADQPMPPRGEPALPHIDLAALSARLAQLNAALGGLRLPPAANAPILSPIDKALGGEAMVGLKTPLAIVAYAGMWIMQAFGAVGTATGTTATTTGAVLTALISAFGGLGVTAKFDRAFQAIAAIAPVVRKLVAIIAILPK